MTLYDFNGLDEDDQLLAINTFGTEIGKKTSNGFNYELYQVDSFYVEMKFHKQSKDLEGMRSFTNPDIIEPYFKNIDISEITGML